MVLWLAAVMFLFHFFANQYAVEIYLGKDHTTPENQKGCSYEGYGPGDSPANMDTEVAETTADLEVDVLSTFFISSEMVKVQGITGTAQELLDGLVGLPEKKKKVLTEGFAVFAYLAKKAPLMSPALGVFTTIFGAIAGVRTPTHKDILDATNKALGKLTEDVNNKLYLMKEYVDDKVIEMEKDLNERRYTFLFMYWGNCATMKTVEEVDLCQREGHRLITASINDFLLFQNRLDKKSGVFKNLEDEEKRRIEVGMVTFRNYALLAMLSLKTLGGTYEKRLTDDERNSCGELRQAELSTDKSNKNDPKTDIQYMCYFKEELLLQTKYFMAYGQAAIHAIKQVARYRMEKQIPIEEDEIYNKEDDGYMDLINEMGFLARSGGQIYRKPHFQERRVKCQARIHKRKGEQKCTYDVQLVDSPTKQVVQHNYTYQEYFEGRLKEGFRTYTDSVNMDDGDLIVGPYGSKERTTANKWCRSRIERRREEYMAMEQLDLERYWSKEVMKVIVCGRMLSESKIKNCSEESLKPISPLSYEKKIRLDGALAVPKGPKNESRVIDGLLSTSMSTREHPQPWWGAHLKTTANISKIYIFFPKDATFGYSTRLKVETRMMMMMNEGPWTICKEESLVSVRNELNEPMVVQCDSVFGNPATKIKITLIDESGISLKLSEVMVYGYMSSESTPTPTPTEYAVELKDPSFLSGTQSSSSASYAFDGLLSTMAISNEGSNEMIWQANIDNSPKSRGEVAPVKYVVTNVNVLFNGKYRNVKITTFGSDGSELQCGTTAPEVDDNGMMGIIGFEQECTRNAEDKTVRIEATPDETPGHLAIREVVVTARKLDQ